jgi:WD40 repeat protein
MESASKAPTQRYTEINEIKTSDTPVMSATLHDTKDIVVAGGTRSDATIRLFNFKTGEALKTLGGHEGGT